MYRKLVAAWMLAIAMTFAIGAGEARAAEPVSDESVVVAVEAPASPAAAEAAPWWLDAAEKGLQSLGALIISAFFLYVGKKVHDNAVLKELMRALEVGVDKTWEDTVKMLKEKVREAGGTGLTARQKQDAKDSAIAIAKENVTPAAKKLLESLGKVALEAIVSKIVRKRKSGDA